MIHYTKTKSEAVRKALREVRQKHWVQVRKLDEILNTDHCRYKYVVEWKRIKGE